MNPESTYYSSTGSQRGSPVTSTVIRREVHTDSPPLDRYHDHTRGMQTPSPNRNVPLVSASLAPQRVTSVEVVEDDSSHYYAHQNNLIPKTYRPINNVNVSPTTYVHQSPTSKITRREVVYNTTTSTSSPSTVVVNNELYQPTYPRSPAHNIREQVIVSNSSPQDLHRHIISQQSQQQQYTAIRPPLQSRQPVFEQELDNEEHFDVHSYRNRIREFRDAGREEVVDSDGNVRTVYRREFVPLPTPGLEQQQQPQHYRQQELQQHHTTYTGSPVIAESPNRLRETRTVERVVYTSPQGETTSTVSESYSYGKPEPLKRQPKPYFEEEFYQDRPIATNSSRGSPVTRPYVPASHYSVNNALPQTDRVRQALEPSSSGRTVVYHQTSPVQRQTHYPNNY